MGIGTSKGAYYEDEFHYRQSQWDPKYDENEITPDTMGRNQELDKSETDPEVGVGLEVNYKPDSSQVDVGRMLNVQRGGPPVPMPEVIAKTKAGDITNEDVDTAINVGLSAGPGTMAGVKGLANLAPEVKGTMLSKLGHAQVLEANGVHPDDVYTTTGFFKGADGRWRYEIPDDAGNATYKSDWSSTPVKTKGGREFLPDQAKLGEILDHPELYKSYPHLKDMDIHYDEGLSGAFYNPNDSTITLGGKPYRNLDGQDVVAAQDKSTLMHEVQHAIQDHEGFAAGGMPGRVGLMDSLSNGTFKLKLEDEYKSYLNEVNPKLEKIYKKFEAAGKDKSVLTDKELEIVNHYKQTRDTYQKYSQEGNIEAQMKYLKLAGETEARNVQNRLDMSPKERSNVPPSATQDFPNDQQIVSDQSVMTTPYGVFSP